MKWRTFLPMVLSSLAGVANAGQLSRAQLHAVAVRALVDEAQLDPASAERVQSVVEEYRGRILTARIDSVTTLSELKRLVRTERPEPRRVQKLTSALLVHRAELQKQKDERTRAIAKVLTPLQFGRLLSSWRSVDRAIRNQVPRG
jgi:hypothetical protein